MTNISRQIQLIDTIVSLFTEENQEIKSSISRTQDIFRLAAYIGNLEKRDRLQLIELLSSQAAISLENTHIYAQELEKSQALQKQTHLLAFRNAISHIASQNNALENILEELVKTIVYYLDAAFARIWLLNGDENVLELRASAGMYTHIDGPHKRVPVGKFKIGLIAEEKLPHITNNVLTDPRVSDKEWAKRERMIAFAGYPLMVEEKLIGVIAMFSRQTLSEDILSALSWVSSEISLCIRRIQAEESAQRKSQELEQALQDLQQAQLQIVQNEKMSALGNLVAGVAHEMNNPLGFISASLQQAKPAFTDIAEHLELYKKILPNRSEEILDHAESIDLDYTLEDFPKMLNAMVIACDRLKNISISLRTFSRTDTTYKQAFNLHEGLDSTILILRHRLKANEQRPEIKVLTTYGNIPNIECFPGQLNQVFMNILANAIDALDESNQGRSFEEIAANPNNIIIKTLVESSVVKIIIADNGKGMNDQVKVRIFDHLFTTKLVGKGTGLGLAIAKQIIEEKHEGKITVNSQLGQGTEFVITLPLP